MSSEVKLRPINTSPRKPISGDAKTLAHATTMETLTHAQTCEKRNTHLHNLCIQMLCHGYHRAYTELFNLVEGRRRLREEQGPGGPLSQEIKLESENAYLDKLKHHLCAAEENERSKQYQKQYSEIHTLANFFRDEKLTWVSDHFYTGALTIAHTVAFDSGRSLCQAHECCALAAEAREEISSAHDHLVDARKISRGRTNWRHEPTGHTWHQENSRNYTRILIKMATTETNKTKHKETLIQACKAADESKLEITIAEANYAFGRAHGQIDSSFVEAQDALQKALGAACNILDHNLIQKITKELAALWKKRGNASQTSLSARSIEFLQLAVEKTADNPCASINALSEMALLYNTCGQFDQAANSIDRAYSSVEQGPTMAHEQATRVASGAIHGNQRLASFRQLLADSASNADSLKKVLKWKTDCGGL